MRNDSKIKTVPQADFQSMRRRTNGKRTNPKRRYGASKAAHSGNHRPRRNRKSPLALRVTKASSASIFIFITIRSLSSPQQSKGQVHEQHKRRGATPEGKLLNGLAPQTDSQQRIDGLGKRPNL